MEDKKQIIKRIVLFYILAFMPVTILAAVFSNGFQNPLFNDMVENAPITGLIGILGMLSPSVAVVLTRLVTKEGFQDHYLALHFKGNEKYYLLAVLTPIIYGVASMFCIWVCMENRRPFGDTFTLSRLKEFIPAFLLNLAVSLILIPHTFGEEWGWRGYLGPKLMKIMKKPLAILVGGILWGLWHAPLTMIGHNFGTDYSFFPWPGIGCMCVFCTILNAFMTYITEKTKSIYPACFFHGINNNLSVMFYASAFMKENVLEELGNINFLKFFIPMMGCMLITTVIVRKHS